MEKYFNTLNSKFNSEELPVVHGVELNNNKLKEIETLTNMINRDLEKENTSEKKKIIDKQKNKLLQLSKICAEAKIPMQDSIDMLRLLKTTYLTDDQIKYINILQTLLDNIEIKLDQVADYTKVEVGDFIPELSSFNLSNLVTGIYDYYKLKGLKNDVKLNLILKDDIDKVYKSDFNRIEQMLNSVLNNAIEFTDHGKIDLIVEKVGQYANMSEYRFIVRDTGTGHRLDKMSKLFQQVKLKYGNSITNSEKEMQKSDFNIISKIANYMGGDLSIESSGYQAGIQFVLNLPLENQLRY